MDANATRVKPRTPHLHAVSPAAKRAVCRRRVVRLGADTRARICVQTARRTRRRVVDPRRDRRGRRCSRGCSDGDREAQRTGQRRCSKHKRGTGAAPAAGGGRRPRDTSAETARTERRAAELHCTRRRQRRWRRIGQGQRLIAALADGVPVGIKLERAQVSSIGRLEDEPRAVRRHGADVACGPAEGHSRVGIKRAPCGPQQERRAAEQCHGEDSRRVRRHGQEAPHVFRSCEHRAWVGERVVQRARRHGRSGGWVRRSAGRRTLRGVGSRRIGRTCGCSAGRCCSRSVRRNVSPSRRACTDQGTCRVDCTEQRGAERPRARERGDGDIAIEGPHGRRHLHRQRGSGQRHATDNPERLTREVYRARCRLKRRCCRDCHREFEGRAVGNANDRERRRSL